MRQPRRSRSTTSFVEHQRIVNSNAKPRRRPELQRAKDQLKVSIMLVWKAPRAMSNLARQEIFFGRQFSL